MGVCCVVTALMTDIISQRILYGAAVGELQKELTNFFRTYIYPSFLLQLQLTLYTAASVLLLSLMCCVAKLQETYQLTGEVEKKYLLKFEYAVFGWICRRVRSATSNIIMLSCC